MMMTFKKEKKKNQIEQSLNSADMLAFVITPIYSRTNKQIVPKVQRKNLLDSPRRLCSVSTETEFF